MNPLRDMDQLITCIWFKGKICGCSIFHVAVPLKHTAVTRGWPLLTDGRSARSIDVPHINLHCSTFLSRVCVCVRVTLQLHLVVSGLENGVITGSAPLSSRGHFSRRSQSRAPRQGASLSVDEIHTASHQSLLSICLLLHSFTLPLSQTRPSWSQARRSNSTLQ